MCQRIVRVLSKLQDPGIFSGRYSLENFMAAFMGSFFRSILSHIGPKNDKTVSLSASYNKSLNHDEVRITIENEVGDNNDRRPNKYLHPLNDRSSYNILVNRILSGEKMQIGPEGGVTCEGYKESWGSTLPQFNEYLI